MNRMQYAHVLAATTTSNKEDDWIEQPLDEPPPPINCQVYSLATVGAEGKTNMNIVTFATPVSLKPARLWALSLYKHTLSRENFERQGKGLLQVSAFLAAASLPPPPLSAKVRNVCPC